MSRVVWPFGKTKGNFRSRARFIVDGRLLQYYAFLFLQRRNLFPYPAVFLGILLGERGALEANNSSISPWPKLGKNAFHFGFRNSEFRLIRLENPPHI